jgi:hypothetical protein
LLESDVFCYIKRTMVKLYIWCFFFRFCQLHVWMHSLQDLVLFFLSCISHACQRRHEKVPGVAVLGSHCGCIFLQIMGKLSIARWVKEKMWGTKLSFLAIRGADKLVFFPFLGGAPWKTTQCLDTV